MNDIREMFGIRFSTLSRQWRRYVEHQLALIGINEVSWSPLVHLLLFGDGISQKELAKSIGIEGPALVRLLDTLEKRQHIKRETVADDRRCKHIYITEEGKKTAHKIRNYLREIESDFFENVTDDQLIQFHQVLDVLATKLDK